MSLCRYLIYSLWKPQSIDYAYDVTCQLHIFKGGHFGDLLLIFLSLLTIPFCILMSCFHQIIWHVYIYIYVWNHCEYSDHAIQAIILSHLWLKWTNMQIRLFFPHYIVLFVILCDGCFFYRRKKGIKGTCPITSYSRFWAVFITTHRGRLSSLIYYNWHEILFFSNDTCRQCTSQSGRSHSIPFLLVLGRSILEAGTILRVLE